MVELHGGALETVLAAPGRVSDVAVAGGEVYAVADAQILRADDGEGEVVGKRARPGIARRIAAGEGGKLWAVTGKGLWWREKGAWTSDDAFPRPRTVLDVAADRRGLVVAAARDTAFVRDGDTWREVAFPPPPPEPPPPDAGPGQEVGDTGEDGVSEEGSAGPARTWVRELVIGADGQLYASTSVGIYRFTRDAWVEVAMQPVSALAVASDGTVIAAAESGAVLWGKPGAVTERSLSELGLAASQLDAVATDAAGHVWLATDGGLAIADDDGKLLARYPPGSLAELGGQVMAIRVIEPPGVLPEEKPPKTGGVTGQVLRDGEPVAGAAVELCARPDTLFRSSPCAEAAQRYTAKTADDGRFALDGVAAGRYGVAIRADKDWIIDLTTDCCSALFAEDRVDVGRIAVSR